MSFHSNKANDGEGKGGAILGLADSAIRVYYSQFVRNTASYGGAVFAGDFSYVEVIESMFEENAASISVSEGWQSKCLCRTHTFDSHIVSTVQGGAFAEEGYSENRFETSSFIKNEAAYGGALYVKEFSTSKSLGNTFEDNLAIEGGAIFSAGFTSVVDSTFENNSAETVSFPND